MRSNDSLRLDLLTRECVSFMHTPASNKTQYAPMFIMRIFWSEAMVPALARVYHKFRTISMLGKRFCS